MSTKPTETLMYVLVISNHVNVQRLYVDNLIIRGYLAVGANSPARIEQLIARHPPALVLLCQVPSADESDYKVIMAHPALNDVPVLLLSVDNNAPRWMDDSRTVYDIHPLPISRLIDTVDAMITAGW
jgi:DNA-binding NtrC family response regulator